MEHYTKSLKIISYFAMVGKYESHTFFRYTYIHLVGIKIYVLSIMLNFNEKHQNKYQILRFLFEKMMKALG